VGNFVQVSSFDEWTYPRVPSLGAHGCFPQSWLMECLPPVGGFPWASQARVPCISVSSLSLFLLTHSEISLSRIH
jgi:hypothetical protein